MTRRLFMQTKRANVELPEYAQSNDQGINAMSLNETVTFAHQDNRSELLEKEDSLKRSNSVNDMQYLHEVTVTAKSKQLFSPERNGRINIDFVVRVPKEMIQDNYRLILEPTLLYNDSVVFLDQLVLKGEHFIDKQKKDSLLYGNYIHSIVPRSDYDSVYLDREGIRRDLRKRQEFYFDLYRTQWRKLSAWLNYRKMVEERYMRYNTQKDGNREELLHAYNRQEKESALRSYALGKDTIGFARRYQHQYKNRVKLFAIYKLRRELTTDNVPKKYREFFLNNMKLTDIMNRSTSEKDSIDIARDRYLYRQIVRNEAKDKNKEKVYDWLVHFPKEEGYIRLDTVIATGGNDFLYFYRQEYPVAAGLKQLRVTMNGKVVAVDRSSYIMPPADTLSYIISSMVQLVDTSLIVRKTKVYRNISDRFAVYLKYEPNQSKFNIEYKDNRSEIDRLMAHYVKYTDEIGLHVDSVEVTATTSLDGSWDSNMTLSQNRSEDFKEYLETYHRDKFTPGMIDAKFGGEDWNTMIQLLKGRKDIINKDSILSILGRAVDPDDTEMQIRLRYRKDYKIIQDSIYPQLRKVDLVFNLSRPEMEVVDSIHSQMKDGYAEGLRLLRERDYLGALELLRDYPDYNTALCLVCLGYNGKAYDILHSLKNEASNGNTEYLLAIVCSSMGKEEEAVEHLFRALQLDPNKVYRTEIDAEIVNLVRNHNLQKKIQQVIRNER